MRKFLKEAGDYIKAYPPLAIILLCSSFFGGAIFVSMLVQGENFFSALICSVTLTIFFFTAITSALMERDHQGDNQEEKGEEDEAREVG